MSDKKNVGIFIDYENIHISLNEKKKQINPDKLGEFRNIATALGNLKKVAPVASWSNFKKHGDAFSEFGYQLLSTPNQKKNASDIMLAVECMSACYNEGIDIFIVFSGDGDFLPVINHLLDHNKEVYLYSVKDSTNNSIVKRLGNEKHFWIEETLTDWIIPATDLPANYENVVKTIYLSLKKVGHQHRGQLFTYIKSTTNIYGNLNDTQIGLLLDGVIRNGLVLPKDVIISGQEVRGLTVNYDHPDVKNMKFIGEHI